MAVQRLRVVVYEPRGVDGVLRQRASQQRGKYLLNGAKL